MTSPIKSGSETYCYKSSRRSRSSSLMRSSQTMKERNRCSNDVVTTNNINIVDKSKERNKNIVIFQEESAKSEDWKKKYIHSTLFLLGYGAYGSVFQVTTRLYSQTRQRIARERYIYHADFLTNYASQRRLKLDQYDKLRDKQRHERLFDTVAIKYEILDQSMLEDGATRFCLFLRREFLVLDTIWRRFPRLLVGFPVVFDFGYIGDKLQYGVNTKYKNIFTYMNLQGEEVKFFADTHNRNLTGVTKISYMTMELLGPSIEDYRVYFEPWYEKAGVKPFFQVRTVFRIADQLLCRLYMLHKAGFVHHDLKPDNLALGHGRAMNTVYLIDFGFAKQVADNPVEDWMGSRKYISIDAYSGERANYAQDIESWFYLIMALLYDSLPWSDDVIVPMLEAQDEAGRWLLAATIKRTWWGTTTAPIRCTAC
ncbi:hypothetical protein BOX15_Mlig015784g1 [Macrostomum lignano]|uniref:Protein kinase domain-containing protein n=1 Tax=Macrostomum lignano TaxID=282301 RepID=A0A267DUK6_9PLAT|nr:hypothetical protein BOX15_Mlig015784g1 [Macrostomum lignano]